jgi:RND family efflux transporter MFP subunit
MKTLCAIALATLAGSCSKTAAPVAAAAPPPSVPVIRVTRADLSGTITLTGEFIPYQDVDVMAKVAGYIRSINVDVGDRVHLGQVLATLEIPEMEDELMRATAAIEQSASEAARAEDDLHRAESTHEMAHLSLTRIESVAQREKGLVPQQEVDQVRSRDLEAEAQVAAAKSNLAAARDRIRVMRADEARLKTMRNYETITAPFEGVVTKRFANQGAMIQAGTASQSQAMPVVRVSQNNLLRLVLPVPESSVANVSIGRNVTVRVAALGRTFTGRVARFTGQLQLSTRTMDTEVEVPNPSLALIPGMYAEVDLEVAQHKGALVVPPDAVDGSGAAARGFSITPQATVHIVPITTGIETAGKVEILQGVSEGDMLVAGRRGGLKEGDRVTAIAASFINASGSK